VKEFGVIINEYGLALPCGNTKPTHTVIEKSAYDKLKKHADELASTIERVIAWETEEGPADWADVHDALTKYRKAFPEGDK